MSSLSGFDELLVGFGQTLRQAGLSIGSDDILTFCSGVSHLDIADLMNVYWAGRATLVRRNDHVPIYNVIFQEYFLDIHETSVDERKRTLRASSTAGATLEIPNTEEGLPGEISPDEVKLGYLASTSEVHRLKAFADCSDEEIRRVRKLISRFRVTPPQRRTHRSTRSKKAARLDLRRMVRETMRNLGEPRALAFKKRKLKLRPLVFILDVSGSMADYSRNLLQFAYCARRANAKVDVFCFGTRLTRITRSLDRRNADEAMRLAGEAVLDWDGGTRIGDSLRQFTREARRSRLGRGAIVVICSDGLDRGEPAALSESMESLSRIAHRVIWVNPHKGDVVDYVPSSMGMIVADPYIDEVHSGHNLASLERLADRLAKVG
ncbi:MAG: VWA domain-containing protein [Candidatus Nanopelagicales bacterium]|nr:VWA domain-containing protein [Candidatus Nanopelagicales bacterium]